jgi:A/G-specific adenine glycosylase
MFWRDDPTPYHVWISEIMLQQTRIEAVKAYYIRFMDALPSIEKLSEVNEEALMKLWEGLGYYNRARNLKKAAEVLVERYNGHLPADYDLLIDLPGIGSYTAGAIASIAYGIKVPAVDGNVLRVLMRYLNCSEDIGKNSLKKKAERSLLAIMPDRPGDFNQAVMELGEVICIPNGEPHCDQCPFNQHCLAKKHGTWNRLPRRADKKSRRIVKMSVMVFEYKDKFGVVKRPNQGLLAGLYEFPSVEGNLSLPKFKQYLKEKHIVNCKVTELGNTKHIFSHVEWHMVGYHILLLDDFIGEYITKHMKFVSEEELKDEYALPIAFHKYMKMVLEKD